MIDFQPMTEDEARKSQSGCFEPGTYSFVVIECEARNSKAGNPMLAVTLETQTPDGPRKVWDYLMLVGDMRWRLREFMQGIGLTEKYESGSMSENDVMGRTGVADIIIEDGRDGYPDKNKVEKYRPTSGGTSVFRDTTTKPQSTVDEADVPF